MELHREKRVTTSSSGSHKYFLYHAQLRLSKDIKIIVESSRDPNYVRELLVQLGHFLEKTVIDITNLSKPIMIARKNESKSILEKGLKLHEYPAEINEINNLQFIKTAAASYFVETEHIIVRVFLGCLTSIIAFGATLFGILFLIVQIESDQTWNINAIFSFLVFGGFLIGIGVFFFLLTVYFVLGKNTLVIESGRILLFKQILLVKFLKKNMDLRVIEHIRINKNVPNKNYSIEFTWDGRIINYGSFSEHRARILYELLVKELNALNPRVKLTDIS